MLEMDLQIKSNKISQLENRISYLQRQVTELERDNEARQMDRDAMRDQLNAQALSPLHFLNDDTRL